MLQVSVLGSPTLIADGELVTVSRRKALAIFLYLVITQRSHSRDHLCVLLWSSDDRSTARAELRRMLSSLRRSPLASYIEVDRQSVSLTNTHDIQVDLWDLEAALDGGDWTTLLAHLEDWLHPLLQGFSAGGAMEFDNWQQIMSTRINQQVIPVLEQLVLQTHTTQNFSDSIRVLLAWLLLDPENEIAHRWLMRCYVEAGNPSEALSHYDQFAHELSKNHNTTPEEATTTLAAQIRSGDSMTMQSFGGGILPPLPQIFVGREDVLETVRQKLITLQKLDHTSQLLVIQGWPGIGKTTLTAMLAHDAIIQHTFSDGVLWASLGQEPDIFSLLIEWGTALHIPHIEQAKSVADASRLLSSAFHDKKMLIIVDDVWDDVHFRPFAVGGKQASTLVTTRLNRVAQSLITQRDELYKLPILDDGQALALIRLLAPDAAANYPDEIRELVHDLEGLPLALQVVGRLLREEQAFGWGVKELLHELQSGTRLLAARAPVDRQADDALPVTVSALLDLSTNHLDDMTRKRFALLGVFAPKPAVFELDAIQAVWETDHARPTIRQLVQRGLLDVVPGGDFQMHALLVQHARHMFGTI